MDFLCVCVDSVCIYALCVCVCVRIVYVCKDYVEGSGRGVFILVPGDSSV